MLLRILALVVLLAFPLACGGSHERSSDVVVESVSDGDTIILADGRHVRLVQIDAPEVPAGECYAQEAARALERMLPRGTPVGIALDPALDHVDRFGRTLAYVEQDGTNVNLELVREGAAAPYFFHGDRGRYASELLQAAVDAERHHRGLWGACPHTVLDPGRQVDARP